ncbi:hypothetical protein JST56_01120 [Candidatus Dependentiae bacterium]|nr:hypothetical protein [Candidatus Dependentiae bacterium]
MDSCMRIFTIAFVSQWGLQLCAAYSQTNSILCISKQSFKRSNPELRKQNRLRVIRQAQLTI